jgi:maltose-binding protein MalE
LSADGKTSTINAPAAVAAVTEMMTLSTKLGDPNIGPTVPGEIFSGFSTGTQTCVVSGEWLYGAFLKPSKSPVLGHYTAFPLPQLNPAKPGNIFWGWAFVVNAQSQNKTVAWKYVNYLEADPNAQIAAVGVWPPYVGLDTMQAVKDTPFGAVVAANALSGGQFVFKSVLYSDIARVLRGTLESLAFQGGDIQKALDDAAQQVTVILQR